MIARVQPTPFGSGTPPALLLVEQRREARGNGSDVEMTALMNIQRAIDSSITMPNKGDLILAFVDSVNATGDTAKTGAVSLTPRRPRSSRR